jgi:predicted permease
MTLPVFYKLLALMATIALGWLALRRGWLTSASAGKAADEQAVLVLGNTVLALFIPALLFRTMALQDLAALPLRTLAAYFVPTLLFTLVVHAAFRRRPSGAGARAATLTLAAVFGNSVQLGIPMAAALFGQQGLALHIALVSVHGLVLLTTLTLLAESGLARSQAAQSAWATLRSSARSTFTHPVVGPVLAGLAWNLGGLGLHPVVDDVLRTLGLAVVPLSLVLIGASLASQGVRGRVQGAVVVSLLKLLALPAVVLVVAHFGFGLTGTPLAVLVMMAALPTGSNALIFAQRYQVLQAEAGVASVVSTLGFMATAALWLAVLGWMGWTG